MNFNNKTIKIILFYFSIIIIITMIQSCASRVTKIMESWVGHHESELIASWGPPSRIMPDGKGGHILIYEFYRDFGYSPGYIYQYGDIIWYELPKKLDI